MGAAILFLLIIAIVFAMIAVHETGHYLVGWVGGLPAKDMKLVLFAFPQHVALRDGDEWVSPVRDIDRYVAITQRHFRSRQAAFWWVAGGMLLELTFTAIVWGVAHLSGYGRLALCVACISLGMYFINVGLMDLPWAVRYRRATGDTSGMWQIAPIPAVVFSILMVTARVLLVILST